MAKPTTIKEALKRWEERTKENPTEGFIGFKQKNIVAKKLISS